MNFMKHPIALLYGHGNNKVHPGDVVAAPKKESRKSSRRSRNPLRSNSTPAPPSVEEDESSEHTQQTECSVDTTTTAPSLSGLLEKRPKGGLLSSTSSDDDSSRSSSCSSKSVSFSSVRIQEYSLTLGDHPCADTFPLSLDWKHTAALEVDFLEYEKTRQQRKSAAPNQDRRGENSSKNLAPRLSSSDRRDRLSQVTGLSEMELHVHERQRQCQEILDDAAFVFFGDDDEDDDFLWAQNRDSKSDGSGVYAIAACWNENHFAAADIEPPNKTTKGDENETNTATVAVVPSVPQEEITRPELERKTSIELSSAVVEQKEASDEDPFWFSDGDFSESESFFGNLNLQEDGWQQRQEKEEDSSSDNEAQSCDFWE